MKYQFIALVLIAAFSISSCNQDNNNPAPSNPGGSGNNYVTYTTNGTTYTANDATEEWVQGSIGDLTHLMATYGVYFFADDYDQVNPPFPFSIDVLIDDPSKTQAVGTYTLNTSPNNNRAGVKERFSQNTSDPWVEYTATSGQVVITEADNTHFSGTYQLTIRKDVGGTVKNVSGTFNILK